MTDNNTQFGSDRATSVNTEQQPYDGSRYQDGEGESADNIDPKRLVRQPTNDDVRWYYRNSGIASTVVDKPVDDAFKHGYQWGDEQTQEFISDVDSAYREANRKARRDGFALIWFRLRDTNKHWQPPKNVQGLHEAKVLTLDDMTTARPLAFEEKLSSGNQENFDYDPSVAAQGTFEEVNTLAQLVEAAEGDALPTQDDAARRLPRQDNDQQQLATDRLRDPDISEEEMEGRLPYGRSRYYDTTDNGIVISNRLDDSRFEKPIGYLYSRGASFDPLLIHPERIYHVVWRGDVDGPTEEQDTWGGYEGDSVLRPIVHLLSAIQKGNWALGQKLFRHSTPLRTMSYEEGATDEQIEKADKAIRNVNAKSSLLEPPGFEIRTVDDGRASSPQVEETYDVLFNQVCAGTEFTRSVLFGTQKGGVQGSETDVKNYFNQIERERENRYEDQLRDILRWWDGLDKARNADLYDVDPDASLEWGPLFKLSRLDQAEAMARHVQMVTTATNNFVMTPDEARAILAQEWADWTYGVLDGEAPVNADDIMNMETGNGDDDMGGNPRVGQNGGGRESGQTNSSSEPAADALNEMINDD